MKRNLLPLLFLLLTACCLHHPQPSANSTAPLPAHQPFINARAILIIRHADIDIAQKALLGNATPLLPAGTARAQQLLPALRDAGITRIITTAALRTQATAAPLAHQLHLTPEIPHNAEAGITEAQSVYRYLAQTAKPADTILLVHHHSVIPGIMLEFGFPNEPSIADATEFDRLYLLLPDPHSHTYHLFRLRYNGTWE